MEPAEKKDKKDNPPNPVIVVLISLFGYPGAGHFMVGAKGLGAVIVVVFTGLTLGVLYEMWIMLTPLYKMYTESLPMEFAPNWARILFWIVSTAVVWIGTAIHSFVLAQRLQNKAPKS